MSCLNHPQQQTYSRAPLFVTAVGKLSTSYWYFLPFLCYINPYNVWRLFYWLPAGEKNWVRACSILSRRRYGGARHLLWDARSLSVSICLPRCQNGGGDGKQAFSSKAIKNEWAECTDHTRLSKALRPFYATGWEITTHTVKQCIITR